MCIYIYICIYIINNNHNNVNVNNMTINIDNNTINNARVETFSKLYVVVNMTTKKWWRSNHGGANRGNWNCLHE